MADWTYQIIDQSGKERKGNIVAESEAEAKNKLKMDGNMVISHQGNSTDQGNLVQCRRKGKAERPISILPPVHQYGQCRCYDS